MADVVDIACPECGATEEVRKLGIGQYECNECGTSFDHTAIRP